MKRFLSILMAATLILAVMAGCGDSSSGTTDNKTLSIAVFEGGFGRVFWDDLIARFEAANPGVKVDMQISPDIGDMVSPQIASGNAPDLLSISFGEKSGLIQSMIKDNKLLEITDVFDGPQYDSDAKLRDKITPGFLESALSAPYGDGKIYFAPQNAGPMGLVYNKTLFDEKGWAVPVTWDDFFALGDKSKAAGIPLFTYQGIHAGYLESILWPSIAAAIGLEDFKKIEQYDEGIWKDQRVIDVLKMFEKIGTGGYLMDGTPALDHTQTQSAQMMNQALFIPNGTWMEDEMKDADRAEGYAFALTPPPVMKSSETRYIMSSCEQLSIPKDAKNPDLAKKFIRFFYTDLIVMKYMAICNAVIPTKNAKSLMQGILTDGVFGMFGAYEEPGAASLIVGFEALPEGSTVAFGGSQGEVFGPIADLMNGKITAEQWAAGIAKACAQITADKG